MGTGSTEPGGPAWRQTTFFPFALTSQLATGATLELKLDSDTYETSQYGTVPVVDAVATHDAEAGRTSVFLVNRSQTDDVTVTIDVAALGEITVLDAQTLNDDADVYAANTLLEQERVSLRDNKSVVTEPGTVTVTLPPVSWSAISLGRV